MEAPPASSERPRFSVARYVGSFLLILLVLEAVFLLYAVGHPAFAAYLRGYASISAAVLRLMGEDVEVVESTIRSVRGSIEVRRGCDAFQPAALLCANVLAFPAAFRHKLAGVFGGLALILALNLLRIISLFWLVDGDPDLFQAWHMTIWPIGFILISLGIWLLWARWATAR
jgi:exosortase/archaeosortase family protein